MKELWLYLSIFLGGIVGAIIVPILLYTIEDILKGVPFDEWGIHDLIDSIRYPGRHR